MNAKIKPRNALQIARGLAREIDASSEPDYKRIAGDLLTFAESDVDLLWDLAQHGANEVSRTVQAEQRQQRDERARAQARLRGIENKMGSTKGDPFKRKALENRARSVKIAMRSLTFNWLTSYAIAGVKLGECRHVELDRAIAECKARAGAFDTKGKFLHALRAKLKDHKTKVADALKPAAVEKIAASVGYVANSEK